MNLSLDQANWKKKRRAAAKAVVHRWYEQRVRLANVWHTRRPNRVRAQSSELVSTNQPTSPTNLQSNTFLSISYENSYEILPKSYNY